MNNYQLCWFEVESSVLNGKGWHNQIGTFNRLPDYFESRVPHDVWTLSRHSTGMYVRFRTNSTRIHARWSLALSELSLPHMPATSVSGLDLYAQDDEGHWRWAGIGRPEEYPDNDYCLNYGFPSAPRDYIVYLPLHNEVTCLAIGVENGADFAFVSPTSNPKPIVYYGTSVVHGIAASRSGACHTAILERKIDHQVINLGFSGRGKMELVMAEAIAEIDTSLYILDCLPNMPPALVETRVIPFVSYLRTKHPNVPILLVEDRSYANNWLVKALAERNERSRAILATQFQQLTKDYANIHYLPGGSLLGQDSEGAVDGSHPSDLGFYRLASAMLPIVTHILSST